MRNQKPSIDVKDKVIARMNALARATEVGLHRDMTVEQILQLGEQLYRWIMEPANDSATIKENAGKPTSERAASKKQIAFIKRLLQNAPDEIKGEIENALAEGITSGEASEIIETLKKEVKR